MIPRALVFAAAAALAFALSSCLDYDEKLVLDKDFGGRLTGTIGIGEALAGVAAETAEKEGALDPFSAEEFAKEFEGVRGIEVESVEDFKEAGKRHLRYTISFNSIESLSKLRKGGIKTDEEGIGEFLGEINIEKESGKWIFERKLTLENPGKESGDAEPDPLAESLFGTLLGNNFFTYEVRFPSKVLSANVREFDDETNTVTWKFSLAQLAREPAVMRAEIFSPPRRLGTFLWLLIAIGAIAVIAAGALYLAFRRRTA